MRGRRRRLGATTIAATAAAGLALGAPSANAAESETVYAVTDANELVTFQSDTPTLASVPVPIVVGGSTPIADIAGIDVQPSTGRLFAVTTASTVFTVDRTTGAATQVGTAPFTPALDGTSFGVDFNPVPNAIRLLASGGAANQSLRVRPADGTTAGTDTGAAAGTTVAAAAYTNSVAGANQSTLYAIDSSADTLVRIGGRGGVPSPNGGAVTTIGPLGADVSGDTGFDVSGATGVAYVSAQATANVATLHRVDLQTGAVTAGVNIGAALDVVDIAVAAPAPSHQFALSATAVKENAGNATVTVTRTGDLGAGSTVNFATSNGTATAGSDYTAASGTLTFPAGSGSQTITVPIADDAAVEGDETVSLALTAPTGGSLGAPAAATVTVVDDDPATVAGPGRVVTVPLAVRADQVLLVAAPSSIRRASLARGLRLRASCAEACVITYTLKLGSRTIGTAKASLTKRGTVVTRLRLSTSGRRALTSAFRSKRVKSRRVVLRAAATDADGGKASRSRASITVTR